jgi:uncharacterized protein YkwD
VLAGINAERAARGLGPLAANGALSASASTYAGFVAQAGAASHTLDGLDLGTRILASGYGGGFPVGEVVWLGSGAFTAQDVVRAWINSPAHNEIIFSGGFHAGGAGCAFAGGNIGCVVHVGGG